MTFRKSFFLESTVCDQAQYPIVSPYGNPPRNSYAHSSNLRRSTDYGQGHCCCRPLTVATQRRPWPHTHPNFVGARNASDLAPEAPPPPRIFTHWLRMCWLAGNSCWARAKASRAFTPGKRAAPRRAPEGLGAIEPASGALLEAIT